MGRIILLSLLLIFSALSTNAGECPDLPEQPEFSQQEAEFKAAWQWLAEPYSVYDYAGSRDRAPLGVGHLMVKYTENNYYNWPREVVLPLWHDPSGDFRAWLRGGLIISARGTEALPLSGAGMVETGYEQSTIIVTEVQGDWLKIRFRPGADGVAWAHRCHLEIGETHLAYQSWQELLAKHGEWLHFRADVPHVLRARPSPTSEKVTMIGLDHKLKLLEIKGDWMQVEVIQPDRTCANPDRQFVGTIHQGWVKWRDDNVGPWVWYYTRGC